VSPVDRLFPPTLGSALAHWSVAKPDNHRGDDPAVHYQRVRDSWFGVRTPDGQ